MNFPRVLCGLGNCANLSGDCQEAGWMTEAGAAAQLHFWGITRKGSDLLTNGKFSGILDTYSESFSENFYHKEPNIFRK
jgi:hypothetical protein